MEGDQIGEKLRKTVPMALQMMIIMALCVMKNEARAISCKGVHLCRGYSTNYGSCVLSQHPDIIIKGKSIFGPITGLQGVRQGHALDVRMPADCMAPCRQNSHLEVIYSGNSTYKHLL